MVAAIVNNPRPKGSGFLPKLCLRYFYEALRDVEVIRELELQTIQVAMEGDKLPRTFGILGKDRKFEATKSINAMTSAINPIMMLIVGAVVGVLVMSIYGPIISVSSSLG